MTYDSGLGGRVKCHVKKESGSSVIFGSMDVTLWVASSDKNAVWGSTDK